VITISNLTSKSENKKYVFSDLNLNFEKQKTSGNKRNADVAFANDVVVDVDIDAIKNSIRNILFQKRHLVDLNINLKQYIGSNISQEQGLMLGEEIDKALFLYEPRVKVEKILVGANIDQALYYITLKIKILNFSESVLSLNALLDSAGAFQFINT